MGALSGNQGGSRALEEAIQEIQLGPPLQRDQAYVLMEHILRGDGTDAQIAGVLTALRTRGETVDELVGFAEAMRAYARPIFAEGERPAATMVDTCGTGGDGIGTFNVSTAAAFVVAGAGVLVAKHGNRSFSSRCGSADVLEALGVNLLLAPERIAEAIRSVGISFIFAPVVHTAMKHAQKARRILKSPTVFNLLGPLTNPARVDAQVVGVFDRRWLKPLAETLGALGVRRAFVAHSRDGLDEVSLAEATEVAEWRDGQVLQHELNPEDFGIERQPLVDVFGDDAQTNARLIQRVLEGEQGSARDIVLLNASLALVAADAATDLRQGVAQAARAIDTGEASARLRALVEFSNHA